MAHTRKSRPNSGIGPLVKALKSLKSFSLCSEADLFCSGEHYSTITCVVHLCSNCHCPQYFYGDSPVLQRQTQLGGPAMSNRSRTALGARRPTTPDSSSSVKFGPLPSMEETT